MRRDLEKRLANLEQQDQDGVVKEISDLMDELAVEAAGGGHTKHPASLADYLEQNDAP